MSSTKDEAVNLLSLDGGGVRGVASLVILHEIMIKIKETQGLSELPKPCEYFHMIAGTSTGGLIAIMLGRLRMSTEEALREYDTCAEKIFSSRNKKWTSITEKFRATALKEAIEDLVRRRNMGEYLHDHTLQYDSKGQCFVCVMPAHKVKIWEAARATTAASFFFKPMTIRVGKRMTEEYIDAAIGCNNPADYLLREAADRLGTGRRLGCLLSIGTGTRTVQIGRAVPGLRNITQTPKFIKELFGTLKSTATDSEETHRQLKAKFDGYPKAYFRFNVPEVAADVKLHEYLKMGSLKSTTSAYLNDVLVVPQIQTAVGVLGGNSSEHGLTLGHTHVLDKDQVLLSTNEAQTLGHTSRFFTGRDDILSKLDACFPVRETGGKPRREFLLYGMGGVGKTQIALKAADDLEDRFKHIFHVDGMDTITASQSYASICQEYALGVGTTNEMKNLALRWIDGLSDEWLMIYDNCPEQERFRPVIPSRNKGNIIYTSRSQGFQADIPAEFACEVKPFEEDDAIDMLLKIAGHEHLRSNTEEMKSAQEIVAAVGYLPLAIESAGAYLREGGCNALTYLQRFHDRHVRPELLSSPNSDAFSPVVPALYTALNLSYEAISAVRLRKGRSVTGTAAEYALKALNLLCFYHNEKIPVLMLERAATERLKWGSLGVCPLSDLAEDRFTDEPGARFINATDLLSLNYPEGTWDKLSFDLGVQTLQRFSLIKLSPNRRHVSMHVMVQDWVIHKMDNAARERQALAARMVLIESMAVSWNRQETSWMRLIPSHVKACLSHKATPVTHDPYQAILDYKLGWYYAEEKQFPKSVEHLSNALRIWKFENGVYSESVTVALLDLGKVYHEMGRASDAELAYLEVLERLALRFADIGTEDLRCRVRAKARLRRRAKHAKLAHLLPRRKLEEEQAEDEETEDEQDSNDNSTVTMDAPNAAMGQDSTARHGRASVEQWIEDVLSVVKREPRQYTPDDLGFELASASTELARLYFDQGSFESGAQFVLKAMEHLKQCGEPHDIRLWALEDELIRRFRQGGDLRYWARRTSALCAFPKDVFEDAAAHDCSFVWQVGYACYLVNEESWEEAYRAFARVMDLAPVYYGVGDRRTLYLMRKMALCQLETGLFEEAEELAKTAIERAKTSYGQSHLHTAKCLDTLSIIMMCQTFDLHPGSEFWSVTEEAYDSARLALPEDHYLTVRLKKRLDMFRTPKPRAMYFVNKDGEEKTEPSLDDKPKPTDGGKARNAESDNFFEYMDDLFAKGEPDSEEAYMAIVNAEYREFTRRKLVAKTEAKKSRKSKRPVIAEAKSSADVGSSSSSSSQRAESEAAGIRDSAPSRRERKGRWKGKEKADVNLSPILEGGPSFRWEVAQEPPDIIEEAPGEESRSDVKGKGKALPMPRSENHVLSGEGTSRGG